MLGYKITALPLASLPSHRPLRLQESATNTNLKHETGVGGGVVGPPGILHNIEVEMINKIRMRSDIFFVRERKKVHIGGCTRVYYILSIGIRRRGSHFNEDRDRS